MKKLWFYIFIATALFGLSLISGIIGWLNQSVLLGVVYFLTSQYLSKPKFDTRVQYLVKSIVLLPFPLMILGMAIFYGQELKHIYPLPPIIILSVIFSEILTYLKLSSLTQRKFYAGYFAVLLFLGYIFYPNYLAYINSSNPYVDKEFPNQIFVDVKGEPINLRDNKIKVIEMWHTNCGACFRKFPAFDEFKKNIKIIPT